MCQGSQLTSTSNRSIGIGYSAADVRDVLDSTWEYLQCAIDGSTNDTSRSDFFALNSYSWCGSTATLQSSGYSTLASDFSNTSVPVFFSEYGCNAVLPRVFDEVQALYGPQLTPVMSGGLVYQYTEDASNYGLVNVSADGSAQLRTDYDNLLSRYSKLNISLLESTNSSMTVNSPPSCDASLITGSGFNNSFNIPSAPSGAQQLIDNGISNPKRGSLTAITTTQVSQQVQDSHGNALSNLAITKLADDQSNTPDPTVTSSVASSTATGTSTAASPSASAKKSDAAAMTNTSWRALTLVVLTVAMALVL